MDAERAIDTVRRVAAVLVTLVVTTVVAVGLAGCGSTAAPGSADGSGSGFGAGAGGGSAARVTPGAGPDAAVSSSGAVSSGGASMTAAGASFSGRVTDADGRPVAQIMVNANSIATPPMPVPELAVLTDASGHYAWYGLAPGPYSVSVSTSTARAGTQVTVVAGTTTVADLVLR
ncbi:MAG: carboxypeptidase-like regulatory domain-containing protein [Lapillicoccus sp.]